ncbi:DUF6262 family protein [Scytonema sp. NUACC26]|uniref:DUF6262 family protein n=1 Tax=Scytonema sp. NUACC26 TaxID=3140176 RepID=UPI0034DCB6E1
MKHERNVNGLRQNAQKKKEEALQKTDEAIQQLIRENRPINFKTVSEVAGVSTAWLYKEEQIKERIERLREQGNRKQKLVPKQEKATAASNEAKYLALKKKLQEVEAENRGLRNQMEVSYGRQRVLADENELQRREINRLTKLLFEAHTKIERLEQGLATSQYSSSNNQELHNSDDKKSLKSKVAHLSSPNSSTTTSNSAQIQSELEALDIKLNGTLRNIINSFPIERTLCAMEVLKENLSKGAISKPQAFLVEAIKQEWKPSNTYKNQAVREIFNEWYTIAKFLKLVSGSIVEGGEQYVITLEGDWVLFNEMITEYPLERLKNMS